MTITEQAEKDRKELEKEAEALQLRERNLQRQLSNLCDDKALYRLKSAERVIDFIRSSVKRLKPDTISRLLTHCLNKLKGNIDGVEIKLKFDFETPEDMEELKLAYNEKKQLSDIIAKHVAFDGKDLYIFDKDLTEEEKKALDGVLLPF